MLFNFVGTLFRPPDLSRKLKPMRNQQRAKAPLHTRHRIVVNIQSATNLPEKVNGEPTNIFVDIVFRVTPYESLLYPCDKKENKGKARKKHDSICFIYRMTRNFSFFL